MFHLVKRDDTKSQESSIFMLLIKPVSEETSLLVTNLIIIVEHATSCKKIFSGHKSVSNRSVLEHKVSGS